MTDPAPPPSAWRFWQNPVFRRYSRSRLRFRGLMVSLILTVVASAFAYLITPMVSGRIDENRIFYQESMRRSLEQQQQNHRLTPWQQEQIRHLPLASARRQEPWMYQRMALLPLLGIQALILFLLGTGQVSGGMTAERDEGMVDYQRLTPMTPLAKVTGYLLGLPVREWVMFAATLPFTALALWRGQVPASAWTPVALVFFTSVVLYHLTGLVTGTVLKNRRWAFLLCMALIFLLYTVVPQGSRMGLPFLRYLTMWPAAMESAGIFPEEQVRAWQLASGHIRGAGVAFFHWTLSDLVFTLLVQGSFILALLIMTWRKWRQAASHLLSKTWALLVFSWLCLLFIGNALPGITSGSLFPSRSLSGALSGDPGAPLPAEALLMGGFYGVVTLILLLLFAIMLTPDQDSQARGLRRAAKSGKTRAPFRADESSAFPVMVILTLAGAASWAWFTRSLLRSPWFGADPGPPVFLLTTALLAPVTLGFQALLESRGGRWPFLGSVFLGIIPVLAGLIILAASRETPVAAVITAGASPLSWPVYGMAGLIPWPDLSPSSVLMYEAAGTALKIWPAVYGGLTLLLLPLLARHWRKRRQHPIASGPILG